MAWWPSFFGSREETVSPVRVQFVLSFPHLTVVRCKQAYSLFLPADSSPELTPLLDDE